MGLSPYERPVDTELRTGPGRGVAFGMREQLRYQLFIVAAAGVIFFTNLGGTALWDMDEALYATCAREMFQRGDWIVPWFNGQMFPEKPPLMFWTMMAGYRALRRQRVRRAILFGRVGRGHGPGGVPSGPPPVQRPGGTVGRTDYRLDDHLHHLGPGGNRRLRADVVHDAGVPVVCGRTERCQEPVSAIRRSRSFRDNGFRPFAFCWPCRCTRASA